MFVHFWDTDGTTPIAYKNNTAITGTIGPAVPTTPSASVASSFVIFTSETSYFKCVASHFNTRYFVKQIVNVMFSASNTFMFIRYMRNLCRRWSALLA